MDKKEEIAKGILAIKETSNALEKHKDIANKIVDFGSNMGNSLIDIYKMNAEYNADIKKLEIQSRERIAEMTMRYQLCRDALTALFAERQTGLNAHYATLDRALQTNDRELIIASLRGISSIIEKNPLESFHEFVKVLDNKDETLLLDC